MSVVVKVEPLYILETPQTRNVVCRVSKFTGVPKPEVRIMYFDSEADQDQIEADIAGSMECDDIQFQLVFYLPVYHELPF